MKNPIKPLPTYRTKNLFPASGTETDDSISAENHIYESLASYEIDYLEDEDMIEKLAKILISFKNKI